MPCADKAFGMSGVAAETRLACERRLRAVSMESGVSRPRTGSLHEALSEKNRDIEPWEVHSELVLVCPEVSERARELLPTRNPDAFLSRLREPTPALETARDAVAIAPSPSVAVAAYALWRLAETARVALVAVGAVVVLALLAEVLH
jgi:hypothetical protein